MQLFRPVSSWCLSAKESSSASGSNNSAWSPDGNSAFSGAKTVLICLAALLPVCLPYAAADEPFVQFIEGLRQRKYFDVAIEHIDELAKRPDLPKEFADRLDLERGLTFRAQGTASRIPEDREQALGKAEQALKKFTKEHSDHPMAPFANSELGQLLFERARSLIWDSESPSNAARKKELQQQARSLVEQAKGIYQTAHDQYKKQYDGYPKFIDKAKDPEGYQTRLNAEVKYLRAWFNLVRCTYERGQTFDKGSKERNETLIRASEEFEAIHTARRTNPIGLQSRLMMGKCFQEQDDINRALGIYNEMLSHKSDSPTVRFLRSIALQYRLICLNHEKKNDFQLVLQEADAWLKDKSNRQLIYSEIGLGILWEKAIAEEQYAKDRALEPKQKTTVLRQALADSKQVARFPGPYREPAVAMGRRITAGLGEKDEEPKDFDTAFERARGLVSQLKGLQEDLDNAKSGADKQKARQAIELQLNEIGRMFELALRLRENDTDPKAVAQARYLLSYVYMRQRKSFDAVILAKYCMTQDRLNDPDSALSATEIAINAAVQAFNDAGSDQTFELDLLKGICEQIVQQYPQSSKGNEARMRLGQVYRDLNQPLEAAQSYMTVPADYSEYGSARIQAGQSFWLAWVLAMADEEENDEELAEQDPETLNQWKADAEKLLQEGIKITRGKLGKDAAPTPEIIAAEVSLATVLNMDGKFDQSIKRLTDGGANSVVKAIDVAANESRPAKGIKSASFAGQTYRLLLRAYVGQQQIDNALKTMNQLEVVGGQDVAAVYTQLGRELQEELQRKKASGDTEGLLQTRTSFEQFLEKVNQQRDKSDYNSLLWIGETYFGLGQGIPDDPAAAAGYYEKASQAYQDILDGNLAEGGTALAIKLRQVRCMRAQGLYEEGVALAKSILTENPLSLDVQFEAAYTLADWGAASDGQPAKLMESIEGADDVIWGWKGITSRLQARQSTPEWETLKDRFLEARYEYINSRYRYAKTGAADADAQLQSGQAEVMMFAQVFPDIDDTWFAKFDRLYQDIQTDRGQAPVALERPAPPEIPESEVAAEEEPEEETKTPETQTTVAETPPTEGPNVLMLSLALALAAGGGFAFYKLMSKPKQRRSFAPSADAVAPPPGDGPAPGPVGDVPDFGNLGAIEAPGSGVGIAAPPKRKKKVASKAPAADRPAAPGSPVRKQPAKKKRVLTPEEAAKYKAAKLAKAKAAAAAGTAPAKKAVKKTKAAPTDPEALARAKARAKADPQAVKKKKLKKRPPPPPES